MKRYMYSMHHYTANVGRIQCITPFMFAEVAPADTWSGVIGLLLRFSALKKALLMDLHVDAFVVYVPHRLVWDGWEDFLAAGPNNSSITNPPTSSFTYPALFYPVQATYSELRLRAYNLFYNEFMRDEDENALSATFIPPENPTAGSILGFRRFGLYAALKRDLVTELRNDRETGDAATVDVTAGTPATVDITEILEEVAKQKMQMRRATYGSRYYDILRGYGIRTNYQMLQRPEIVAMARSSVNITDVVATDSGTGLGSLAGHGIDGLRIKIRKKQFPEHGTLMGVVCVRPVNVHPTTRDWFDIGRTFEDYFEPGLACLPPREVQVQDFINPDSNDTAPVGYTPWYQWYRKIPNRVALDLSTQAAFTYGTSNWNASALINIPYARRGLSLFAPTIYDNLFNDVSFGHYQLSAVNGLKKLSAVPKEMTSVVSKCP